MRSTESRNRSILIFLSHRLASKVSDSISGYSSSVQTEYDKSHPIWTVTFHYHTQDMFNALNTAEDEAMVEAAARIRESDSTVF
jgi:hypothetical protein